MGVREPEPGTTPPAAAGELLTHVAGELLHRVATATTSVWLASPFLSTPVAERIVAAIARSGATDRRLLTAVSSRPVRAGALSVDAIELLLDAGFAVRSVPNLHAKLSVVDGDWGVVGSGNLTGAGLGGVGSSNVELAVRLNRRQVRAATSVFAGWWDGPAAGDVTAKVLAPFGALPAVVSEPKDDPPPIGSPLAAPADDAGWGSTASSGTGTGTGTGSGSGAGSGAAAPPASGVPSDRRHWVKAMFGHNKPAGEWWFELPYIHDRHRGGPDEITFRPRYRVGDLVALYVTQPSGPGRIPAVFEVENVARDGRREIAERYGAKDAARYGWLTDVTLLRATTIDRAPTLDVVGKTPRSLQIGRARIHDLAAFEALADQIPLVRDGR